MQDSKLKSKNTMVRTVAVAGIMSAAAVGLMYLEFPISILFPSFLKFDFSDLPALIAAFAIGPVYGVVVEAIKNILHMPASTTQFVGELANFLVGGIFVFSAGIIYKYRPTRKTALVSMAAGTVIMSLCAAVLNYFFIFPFYANLYIADPTMTLSAKLDIIVGMFTAIMPFVKNLFQVMCFSIIPFNLLKGIVISVITFFVYKKISTVLKK
ncbi:MAG: ECF transporter S component [Oscillospiraceae bacterium]|nr:ECF transporter S component [Oscillospiraceae bacterium]